MIILTEAAFQRKVYLRHLYDVSKPVKEHLLKYYTLEASEEVQQKWISTIIRELWDVFQEKPKTRPIYPSVYFKYIYEDPIEGTDERMLEGSIRTFEKETGLRRKRSAEGFIDGFAKSFLWWACQQSVVGYFDFDEVKAKLEELAG